MQLYCKSICAKTQEILEKNARTNDMSEMKKKLAVAKISCSFYPTLLEMTQCCPVTISKNKVICDCVFLGSPKHQIQSIGTPRSGALRSGAESNFAGAHPERNSEFIIGAQVGAQLRKLQERKLERNFKICAPN